MNTHRQFLIPLTIILIVGLAIVAADLAAGPIKVNSANPNSGTQGDEPFEVVIKGIGLTKANKVRFLVKKSTSNTGGVGVVLLSVDGDETVTTLVTIPPGATVADYDIEVQLSNGRKGKGTTLFKVSEKNASADPLCVTVRDAPSDNFAGDDDGPIYCDGVGPVTARIDKFRFGLDAGQSGVRNFFLDLTDCFDSCDPPSLPGNPPLSIGLTRGWHVFSTSPDGAQFLKMTVDDTKLVNFHLDFFDADDRLWRIQFNPSECPLANMATVTKTNDDPDTWEFEAGDVNGDGAVACLQLREGRRKHYSFHGLHNMPFKIWVDAP